MEEDDQLPPGETPALELSAEERFRFVEQLVSWHVALQLAHPEAFAVRYTQRLATGATEVDEPLAKKAFQLLIPHCSKFR
ncbi:MAG TPA: hypothetical protein VIS76_12780 [Pseudomonadales bacterium]